MSGVQVGLTGGIGSGKSTVAKLFAELGAKVVDADVLAREATEDASVLASIRTVFGDNVFTARGALDRKRMAELVFHNPGKREQLNAIVHPWVQQRRAELIAQYADAPLVIHDIPLLYEVGMEAQFSAVVVVTAKTELRQQRVYERSGLSVAEFTARDEAQLPLAEKAARADYVINNDGSFRRLQEQVKEIWRELVAPEQ